MKIRLEPLNRDVEPVVIAADEEADVEVLAEMTQVSWDETGKGGIMNLEGYPKELLAAMEVDIESAAEEMSYTPADWQRERFKAAESILDEAGRIVNVRWRTYH